MNFSMLRRLMVEEQLVSRGVKDKRVLAAMGAIPREVFVPEEQRTFAYEDRPLAIELAQTISQPYIVALMAEAARVSSGDRVLEVGAGSGYAAAVFAELGAEVYAIERHPELTASARARLTQAGYGRVHVLCGDGTYGLPAQAPFDAIIVSAAAPAVPSLLLDQLALEGRLIVPVGSYPGPQKLLRVVRESSLGFSEENLGQVHFVRLVGAHGWPEGPPPDVEQEEAEPRRVT